MTYPIPRNHFLYVHDGLRSLLGKSESVQLSAFVKDKKPFQCDMVVNSPATDPDHLNGDRDNVSLFIAQLQEVIPNCTIRAHQQRVDIIFRDHEMIRLALGAPRNWLADLKSTSDINAEPDWELRNRLRISLGFDEQLFTGNCSFGLNMASRTLEKYVYEYYKYSPLLGLLPDGDLLAKFQQDYRLVTPPVMYWQAHCYSLSQSFPIKHYEELQATVWRNFALYYKKYPFDNPFCAGEDLNTMACVELLCSVWQQSPISSSEAVVEAVMESQNADGSYGSGGGGSDGTEAATDGSNATQQQQASESSWVEGESDKKTKIKSWWRR